MNLFIHRSAASAALVALAISLVAGCTGNGGDAAGSSDMAEHAVNHPTTEADLATTRGKHSIASDNATLWVNGLGCPLCASNIDKQLIRVSGVSKVNVDLSDGRVDLAFKSGSTHPSPARLADAVADAGFTLVKVEEKK